MEIIATPAAMRSFSSSERTAGRTIALVPTMGALHAGHLELIAEARQRCDSVVVSIFVNPLQFNRTDDFDAYPRVLDADLDACREAGVTAVYSPTAQTMYPNGFDTFVEPAGLAAPFEGAGRPGHFRGVTTVVAKLFNAVRPDVAVFGEKDFQQLAIVRRMALDLDMGVDVVGLRTVREPDGLAMSSRNRRLDPTNRAAALVVPAALDAVVDAVSAGERSVEALRRAGEAVVAGEPLARLEYLGIADPDTLQALDSLHDVTTAVVLIAVWFGEIRLIDNRILTP